MLRRVIVVALLSLALSACFHLQLKGSVGGGSLSISLLRSPNDVLATTRSKTPDDLVVELGQESWDNMKALLQLLVVGIATLEPTGIDPNALYLLTATGGDDYDPDGRSGVSASPAAVQAPWHAIVSGQRIIEGNVQVSALTEALYLQVQSRMGEWSDDQIKQRLNAAAQLVVGDVDDSGSVDYDDVLRWIRRLDGPMYSGQIAAVDALADAIIAGQPATMINERAKGVLGGHRVVLKFDAGSVTVKTLNWESPITAANFLAYVGDGFYDQMLVHRAINGFMIQMGYVGITSVDEDGRIEWALKTPGGAIVNESSNGVANTRRALAMARTNNPDSASSQFFINQVDNKFLDYGSSENPDGYAVFAYVVAGMPVVDEIAAERTATVTGIGSDVPARGVVLESATLL